MNPIAPTFLRFMRASPWGGVLSHDDEAKLGGLRILPRHYDARTVISREGDTDQRIFVIISGWACTYRDLANGDRQIIDFPVKGDFAGLQGTSEAYYSLASITDLTVFEVPRRTLMQSVELVPKIAHFLFNASSRQHAHLVNHLTNTGRRTALERTAHLLLELHERLAVNGECDETGFHCPITQPELADALGLTPIHMNRTLRELREQKIVLFRSGFVEFIDRPKLIELCGYQSEREGRIGFGPSQ